MLLLACRDSCFSSRILNNLILEHLIFRIVNFCTLDWHRLQAQVCPEEERSWLAEERMGEGCCLPLSILLVSIREDNLSICIEAGNLAPSVG